MAVLRVIDGPCAGQCCGKIATFERNWSSHTAICRLSDLPRLISMVYGCR